MGAHWIPSTGVLPVVLAQPSGGPFSSGTDSKPIVGPEVVGTLAVLGQLEALAVVELDATAELVLDAAGALEALAEELDELEELLPQAETASPVTAISSSVN